MRDDEDLDAIVDEAAKGQPLREIAKAHGMSIADVNHVLDAAAAHAFSGEQLRREWYLEAHRLRNVIRTHYARRDDVASAAICIKASERLCAMTGMNAPSNYSVQLAIANAPTLEQSSTERMRARMAEIEKRWAAGVFADERPNGGDEAETP
jgi:hypothetical protein